MTGRRRRWAAVAGAVAFLATTPAHADAAELDSSGWWTSSAFPIAPDAPPDGLVVQGGPTAEDPTAYAAVSFGIDPDESVERLELVVAEGSLSTPIATLVVCPVTGSVTSAHGEPRADGPTFDCTISAEGTVSDDGTSYTFDVDGLASPTALEVAVVPTGRTDRVVFDPPDGDSLVTASRGRTQLPGSPPPATTGANDPVVPPPGSADPSFDQPTPSSPSFEIPAVGGTIDLPTPAVDSAPDDGPSTASTDEITPPTPISRTQALPADDDGSPMLPALLGLLAALGAAGFWTLAGRSVHEGRLDMETPL